MRIGIVGYGKMGKMIEQETLALGHDIAFIADSPDSAWAQADVLIEFTQPEGMMLNLKRALSAEIPMVTGTTGWNDKLDEVTQLVNESNGSFFHASNFSLGVNIFFEINRQLARIMANHKQYKVHIEETHHTEKKDSPSGTAITTAQGILESYAFLNKWAKDHTADHELDVLPITSHRLPEVPGTHIVKYESDVDCISLSHEAKNRKGFARGALMAAAWLPEHRGVFTMKDILTQH